MILYSGCDRPQRAVEMISYIAEQERLFLKDILTKASAFSDLSDGSQARKTGSEKELVYVRMPHLGAPVCEDLIVHVFIISTFTPGLFLCWFSLYISI